ncbi:hypothetical protein V6N11_016980 [Hibiscus sabdariffa]|uniref:Inosine/uridine-preferring nucleoside hydrolase domain-containing protein n=1 Tax=Hibiscus sabdariffa TaxID=183260 RepID=A0ABR2TWR9_9ROSI
MINAISSGARAVFLMGAHTNFAIFLMTCPHLKKNVEHIYAMGGSVRPYCLKNDGSDNSRECSDIGHLYPQDSSPYAEFNIFSDPFAAYEVLHSGIPFTLIPLDATNTVPVTLSIMRYSQNHEGENEFAEMQYMNITAVTLNLNQPYGALGGSNPLITGIQCQSLMYTRCSNGNARSLLPSERKRKMSDNANRTGWLDERRYRDGNVSVLVAVKGKANQDEGSTDHSIRECKLSDSGVYIVRHKCNAYDNSKENVFTVRSNGYEEFNMFLNPSATRVVFTSSMNITLVPLQMQGRVCSFYAIFIKIYATTQTSCVCPRFNFETLAITT